MYCGNIVEQGTVFEIFENPRHPYTIGLMQSLPKLTDHKAQPLEAIKGMVPSLYDLPTGCVVLQHVATAWRRSVRPCHR